MLPHTGQDSQFPLMRAPAFSGRNGHIESSNNMGSDRLRNDSRNPWAFRIDSKPYPLGSLDTKCRAGS